MKAIIFSWISYFSMEIFVSNVLLGLLDKSLVEMFSWIAAIEFSLLLVKVFPFLPLPPFVNVDELLIQPLCATVAEYYPVYVANPELPRVLFRLFSISIGFIGGCYICSVLF
ncbi:hypothetical protein DdX_21925 [Ditylenchus destructor]|uniref:Uncharacterized protein n=1 Tax=Ditylenchus destructor TaxID=166010 RepID=A0AAD4MIV2_9BILA|nr:hypothetical protein DdX_21925 [Ditylenchus destructor]